MSTSSASTFTNQDPDKGLTSLGFSNTLSLFKEFLFNQESRIPRAKLPEVKPDFKEFLEPSEWMRFVWFGHSTLLLNLDGKTILIDPVFYEATPIGIFAKRFQKAVITPDELPNIDFIVISHDHYDHLDKKTIAHFLNKETLFVVPTGVGNHLSDWGIAKNRITELAWDQEIVFKDIHFRAMPAQHFSGRGLFDRNETLWASWIIQGKDEKIYYSGDSGYSAHFEQIGDKYGPFDYAFIENGQYNELWPETHMQPEEMLQAFVDLNARHLIPVHWGMFDLAPHHWSEPITRLSLMATAWEFSMITPRLGEVVNMMKPPQLAWWEELLRLEKVDIVPKTTKLIPEPALK